MKNLKIKVIVILFIILSFCDNIVLGADNQIFTQKELNYINEHKEIYIAGNPNIEPVESFNGEEYEGIIPDVFKKISEKTGMNFVYINGAQNWENYALNNQVEIISGLEKGTDLGKYKLKNSMDIVKFSVNNNEKIITIAFTEIADDELVSIIEKAIKEINILDMQEIIAPNMVEEQKNMSLFYVLIGVIAIFSVISIVLYDAYRKYKRENLKSKYIDNITNFGNYQSMEKKFNSIITENNRTSYCVINMGIDIAHVEEVYGYSEVQKILKDIANIINKNINKNELFARIYKDSFVIMADFVSEKSIEERIGKIVNEIRDNSKENNKIYGLNIYSGVYILNQTDSNLGKVVYNAMLAKQSAKEQGMLVKMCTQALIMKAKKEHGLEKEMLTALRDKEFLTYVQPLINLQTMQTACLESLARWESPRIGLLKPSTFIPIFENNNLIDELDFQMYENICKMISKSIKLNKQIYTVFCNFSKKTLENSMFFNKLQEIAEKYQIRKEYIGIILESKMYSITNLKFTIKRLREAGFKILLSSFDPLIYSFKEVSQLQVDYIKFSTKLTENLNDYKTIEVISGIIQILHELNIKVICEEFNETKTEAQKLKSIGVDVLQGNAYYPPMPIEEII